MPFSVSCRDVGVECDFVAEGKTEAELYENVRDHAKKAHGMTDIPSDILKKLDRLMKEDKAA